MIPDSKKEEIRQLADIVEVISDYVKLRRSGRNFAGLCPFHDEKTPSFSVSPSLGIFKCFGCGEGGDVFNFVMKMDGVGFEEAVRTLAERYHVILPEKDEQAYDPQQHLKDGIFHALRFAGTFFHQHLAESDEAEKAREYLKNRAIPWKTVRKYGLGYAPGRFDGLLKAAGQAGINLNYLVESGLIKERERGDGHYDTFRARIMFPIFNPAGKVIAFGGRTLSEDKKIPKYINSPQTPVYNKSEVLYGIQLAKNEIRKTGEVMLVEGYTDVISMQQSGLLHVVSASGTSLTESQVRILKRYGESVLMIFDADTAGVRAAERGISIALQQDMGVRVLTLPEGEDPDSFVRQFGSEGFVEYMNKHAVDFLRFMIHQAQVKGRWEDPMNRSKVIRSLLETIAVIPRELSRMNYLQELSSLSRIGDRTLLDEMRRIMAGIKKRSQKTGLHRTRPDYRPGRLPGRSDLPGAHMQDHTSSGMQEKGVPSIPSAKPLPQGSPEKPESGNQKGFSQLADSHLPDHPHRDASSMNTSDRLSSSPVMSVGMDRRRIPAYEKELIRLMLCFGERLILFIGSHCNEDHFEDLSLREFYRDIMQRYQNGEPVSVEVYGRKADPYPRLLGEIVMERYAISPLGMKKRGVVLDRDADPVKVARGALKAIKIRFFERNRLALLEKFRKASDQEKPVLQEWITRLAREQSRYQQESLVNLFPGEDPPEDPDENGFPERDD